MKTVQITFQPSLGNTHGISLRSAYCRVGKREFVGTGVADNDATAKEKALSELVERASLNKESQSKQTLFQCIWDTDIVSLSTLPRQSAADNSQVFSSACRKDVGDAVRDAVNEMHERAHLAKWCRLLVRDHKALNVYELIDTSETMAMPMWRYIRRARMSIYLSWVGSHGFMPCLILLGRPCASDRVIVASSSGKTNAEALYSGLLDIAKILVVEENGHRFSEKPSLFHSDGTINRLCDVGVNKRLTFKQISQMGGERCRKPGTFAIMHTNTELSDALKMHPMSISLEQASMMVGPIEIDEGDDNGRASRVRNYFS